MPLKLILIIVALLVFVLLVVAKVLRTTAHIIIAIAGLAVAALVLSRLFG